MARESGSNDSELKEQIARSRAEITRDVRGLRYELDFPRKIRRSFQTQTLLWIGGAIASCAGLSFLSPGRKKKYLDGKRGRQASNEKPYKGDAFGVVGFSSHI